MFVWIESPFLSIVITVLSFCMCVFVSLSLPSSGLSLVVGLVLYISNINDEMLNRTKTNEAYFSYKYGWSFAFAAISFLLTEVTSRMQVCDLVPCKTWIHKHTSKLNI